MPPRLTTRPKFYVEEDAAYPRLQKRMLPSQAVAYLCELARRTGEAMPILVLEPTGPHHAADRKHIWAMMDDLTPITLCHEFAHVIQCRSQRLGDHSTAFATLVCLMVEVMR